MKDRTNNLKTLRRRHTLAAYGVLGTFGVSSAFGGRATAQTSAAERHPTPAQSLGPFYPRSASERPVQTDNDLLSFDGERVLTKGTPLFLTGRVASRRAQPIANARVEIWQCDANAVYHHPAGGAEAERDRHFQGYGETRTDAEGIFFFRTIQPVPYPGRTAHIHLRIEANSLAPLATQLYLANEAGNARDFLYRQLNEAERAEVTLSLRPTESTHPLARGTRLMAAVNLVLA
jgi:protocatechuate 3,4-dioxygenase beta subunit